MFHKIGKTITAVLIMTSMTVATVFADDVTDLTNKKNNAQSELDSLQSELAYLLAQMDDMEAKMAEISDKVTVTTQNLEKAQETQKAQYQDMKLRIKYMYEDQGTSIADAILTAKDMGEVLNKSEYMQQIYDYDREKLGEMAATAATIKEEKAALEQDQKNLQAAQDRLTEQQALLYSTIDEKQKSVSNFNSLLTQAVAQAAARSASSSSAAAAAAKSTYVSNGDSSVGAAIVAKAYDYLGTPYRSGGASPGGFDCSGFTSYVLGQFGIGLGRTTGSQSGGGQAISGLSQALPGDLICYPGHVGIYIGGGQIIHASVPGDYVKIASAGIMTITGIRRYW